LFTKKIGWYKSGSSGVEPRAVRCGLHLVRAEKIPIIPQTRSRSASSYSPRWAIAASVAVMAGLAAAARME